MSRSGFPSRLPSVPGAPLLACSLWLAGCGSVAPVDAPTARPVQAYVSAALLGHWCRSPQPVDVEACLSYLRGNFDTIAALRAEAAGSAGVACIPPTAAVTELRERVRQRPPQGEADRAVPAARMLAELWQRHYPCEGAAAPGPAATP